MDARVEGGEGGGTRNSGSNRGADGVPDASVRRSPWPHARAAVTSCPRAAESSYLSLSTPVQQRQLSVAQLKRVHRGGPALGSAACRVPIRG
eukprot:221289-Chlamydomonas_euryale.AAC.11